MTLLPALFPRPGLSTGDARSTICFCEPSPDPPPPFHRRSECFAQTHRHKDDEKRRGGLFSNLKPTFAKAEGGEVRGSKQRRTHKHSKEQRKMAVQCVHVWDLIKSDTNLLQWHCAFCHDGPRTYIWQCKYCTVKACRTCAGV
ncbi:hypothetical protein RB594_007984 [Gaeumannomyces avenae]